MSSSVVADALQGTVSANVMENDEFRKQAAINALVKVYGPTAYDPQAALQMSSVDLNKANTNRINTMTPLDAQGKTLENQHNAVMNPLLEQQQGQINDRYGQLTPGVVENQGLVNQGLANTNQRYAAETPYYLQQQQTAVQQGQENLRHSQATNPSIESQQASAATSAQITLEDQQTLRTQGGIAALGALQPQIKQALANGQDPNKVFDAAVGQVSKITGLDASRFEQFRSEFLQDPDGAMTHLNAVVNAAQLGRMAPADRAKVAEAQMNIAKSAQEIAKSKAETEKINNENQQTQAGRSIGYQTQQVAFDNSKQNLQQAISLNAKAGTNAAIAEANPVFASKFLPDAANFVGALNSVKSDIVNNVIRSFKESTQAGQASGVGRVMQKEIGLWEDAYAAVKTSMSPQLREQNMRRLLDATNRLEAASRDYFASLGVPGAQDAKARADAAASGKPMPIPANEVAAAKAWLAANPNHPQAAAVRQAIGAQ